MTEKPNSPASRSIGGFLPTAEPLITFADLISHTTYRAIIFPVMLQLVLGLLID
jgi:hypothetical protein